MTKKPEHTAEVEGKQLGVDAETVNADDLGIGGSDFVSDGDILPLGVLGPAYNKTASTTSTSFETGFDVLDNNTISRWGIPSDATIVVNFTGAVSAGTDETYEVKVWGPGTGDFSNSISTTTNARTVEETGWHQPPNIPSGNETMFVRHKTDPGTNSSSIQRPTMYLGVQL